MRSVSLTLVLVSVMHCQANGWHNDRYHESLLHQARQLVQHLQQHEATTATTTTTNARDLQRNTNEQCEKYNLQLANVMTCECSRLEQRDTLVNCTYDEPQCTEAACFDGGILIYQDLNGLPYKVTTCTNITSSNATVDRLLDTCVEVNGVPGTNLTDIESCSATLNGEKCNYCHPCATSSVTIDCCNVLPDMKQEECLQVQPNGVFIPVFPVVTGDQAGQCKGKYGYSAANAYSFSKIATIIIASLAVFVL